MDEIRNTIGLIPYLAIIISRIKSLLKSATDTEYQYLIHYWYIAHRFDKLQTKNTQSLTRFCV